MTHKQFKKANSLILSTLTAMLLLLFLLLVAGCVSKREVTYKKIYFADTNGVTTVYYTPEFEQYIVFDDGKAKPMLTKP
mgnify:CR=1 FL=1